MNMTEEEQEMTLLDSILPDVVFDAIAVGDSETFLEAIGADGLGNAAGDYEKNLAALRDAIACNSAEHVGKVVIEYVTNYYNYVCYDAIKQDLESYSEKYAFSEQNV